MLLVVVDTRLLLVPVQLAIRTIFPVLDQQKDNSSQGRIQSGAYSERVR